MSDERKHIALEKTVAFLNEIGLSTRFGEVPKDSFLGGVQILEGGLVVSREARTSNVLHEAGHLALIPSQFRSMANNDLNDVFKWMFEQTADIDPMSDLGIAVVQSGDCEATAWAWAAGKAIGLAPEEIIHGSEYSGTGRSIRHALESNSYIGINGLAAAGLCVVKSPTLAKIRGLPIFPELCRWVQPSFAPEAETENQGRSERISAG